MTVLEMATRPTGERVFFFFCPGCNNFHLFDQRWAWNGSLELPTFSPSLLCDPNGDRRCHLFVRDGKLEYLSDCHHALAGKTITMETVTDK